MDITTNMLKTKILRLLTFVFPLLSLASTPSYSEDCPVTTDARAIMSTIPNLQSEKLITSTGKYSAVLKNGDIVMATFSTCGLGMTVHYLSVRPLTSNERMTHVKTLLNRILPSEAVVKKVMPHLEEFMGNSFDQPVILDGLGDQHRLLITPSPSPLYTLDIQYDWIPPEY